MAPTLTFDTAKIMGVCSPLPLHINQRRIRMKLIQLPGMESVPKPPPCLSKGPFYIICGKY